VKLDVERDNRLLVVQGGASTRDIVGDAI